MITNERQYAVAKSALQKLLALSSFQKQDTVSSEIFEIQKNALRGEVAFLSNQIQEYELLKSGKIHFSDVTELSDLSTIVIKARIANGLTQSELAHKLGIKEQQIQRYEAEEYRSTSLNTLIKIANVLGITFSGNASLVDDCSVKYPIKEIYSRGWFEGFAGNAAQAIENGRELIIDFLEHVGLSIDKPAYAFQKQNLRINGKFNPYALHAWHARVLVKAQSIDIQNEFKWNILTDEWFANLVALSTVKDSPLKAKEYLLNSGIRFIVEPHLSETHIDGASLMLKKKHPVIALTLRHDRLDNFWFVLLHELAHLKLHLSKNQDDSFFDNLDEDIGGIEKEADDFALDKLIPSEKWDYSISRFMASEESVLQEASIWNVSPAIVAGKIRKETANYTLFNKMIGIGDVRRLFVSDIEG